MGPLSELIRNYVLPDEFLWGWQLIVCLLGILLWQQIVVRRARGRALRRLRSLPRSAHALELSRYLNHAFRESLQAALKSEVYPTAEPPVERFLFSVASKRRNEIAFWLLVACGLCAVAVQLAVRARTAVWVLIMPVLMLVAVGAYLLRRRADYLNSVLEISAFALSEVHPNGLRRTLLWRDARWLLNRPRLGRVEVTSAQGGDFIAVHYQRLEFARALELVVEYGGFHPSSAAT